MNNKNELLLQKSKELVGQLSTALSETTEQLKEAEDKLQTYDYLTNSKGWYTFKQVSKMLTMKVPGRKDGKMFGDKLLFKFAREQGILRQNNEPFQPHLENGYFKVFIKKLPPHAPKKEINVTMVSIKGINYLRKRIEKRESELKGE